ncbi:hypothetical protein NL533_35070, partial [Klebsiella pneumoniae]|nr:hypothetical protein [Klebsiella pneumoniae]
THQFLFGSGRRHWLVAVGARAAEVVQVAAVRAVSTDALHEEDAHRLAIAAAALTAAVIIPNLKREVALHEHAIEVRC